MNSYEQEQLKAVVAWENEEPGVFKKALGIATYPLQFAIQKVVPPSLLESTLGGAAWLAESMTDVDDIKRDGSVLDIIELKTKNLELSDQLADSVHNWALCYATAQGAAGGVLGLPALPAAIPALIVLALRTIMKIGLCYGMECRDEKDRNIAFSILAAASANDLPQKVAITTTLRAIETILVRETWKEIYVKAGHGVGNYAAIVTIRSVAKELGINISKRAALKAVPIVGAAAGAVIDEEYIRDVGWAARRSFQRLWLAQNYPEEFEYEKTNSAS